MFGRMVGRVNCSIAGSVHAINERQLRVESCMVIRTSIGS
jgi:hypothetical protein